MLPAGTRARRMGERSRARVRAGSTKVRRVFEVTGLLQRSTDKGSAQLSSSQGRGWIRRRLGIRRQPGGSGD
jgi:hypothetical protein